MDGSMVNETDSTINTTDTDLSNLMTWAHTHGNICTQIPSMQIVQQTRSNHKYDAVLWICSLGHAYNWPCQGLYLGSAREKEAKMARKKQCTVYDFWKEDHTLHGKNCMASVSGQNMRPTCKLTVAGQGPQGDMMSIMCDRPLPRDHPPRVPSRPKASEMGPSRIVSCSMLNQHCQDTTHYQKVCGKKSCVKEEIIDVELIEADEDGHSIQATGSITVDSRNKNHTSEVEHEESEDIQGGAAITANPSSDMMYTKSPLPPDLLHEPCGHREPTLESRFVNNHRAIRNSEYHYDMISQSEPIPSISLHLASTPAKKSSCMGTSKHYPCFSQGDLNRHIGQEKSDTGQKGLDVSCHDSCLDSSTDSIPELEDLSLPETELLDETGMGIPAEEQLQANASGVLTDFGSCTLENHLLDKTTDLTSLKKNLKKTDSKKVRNIADIKIFRDWLSVKYSEEHRAVHEIPPSELDSYLVSFYNTVRKVNGLEFSANSLLFFQTIMDRYLRGHMYECNILKGTEFASSQEALKYKYEHLCQMEKERDWTIVQNLTDKDMENLRKKGILNRQHPEGLLNLMFINNVRGFGAQLQLQSTALLWGHITLKKTKDGSECLEWTRSQTGDNDNEESALRVYSNPYDPDNCPVLDYQEFACRRPLDMAYDTAPFYLSPKPLYCLWDQIWYSRKPPAKSKMGKVMKTVIHHVKQSICKSNFQENARTKKIRLLCDCGEDSESLLHLMIFCTLYDHLRKKWLLPLFKILGYCQVRPLLYFLRLLNNPLVIFCVSKYLKGLYFLRKRKMIINI